MFHELFASPRHTLPSSHPPDLRQTGTGRGQTTTPSVGAAARRASRAAEQVSFKRAIDPAGNRPVENGVTIDNRSWRCRHSNPTRQRPAPETAQQRPHTRETGRIARASVDSSGAMAITRKAVQE